MKRIWLPVMISIICFSACDEIPPSINPIIDQGECPTVNASLVNDQARQVLIEEFTGVRCVNCPAGSEAIENLLSIHGNQLIAVSIHAGFFSNPYSESLYDFRTTQGDAILSFVGEPLGFPTAVINRKLFEGESDLQVSQNQWADFVNQETNILPRLKIEINPLYDADSREATAEISLFIEEDMVDEDIRLSIMLAESHIIDYQLTPGGKQADYEHNHVLRALMTNFDGNPLTEELVSGASFCKKFSMFIPDSWEVNDIQLIAFVHSGGSSKEILQAQQKSLIN